MTFNSIQFIIFFPIVVAVYFLLPYRWRWLWLLSASCYFYMVFIPVYILVLFLLIGIDYTTGILIERSHGVRRRGFLLLSILSTVTVLFVFKYFNFFNADLAGLARVLHWNYPIANLSLILPIGLSFHTFQSLNYVIEVYRGHWKAEKNLGIFALYVMFFPQLVSGPIERARNLLPQFYERHDFDERRVISGIQLMMWGMFQKVVIADRLALVVNQVYGHLPEYQGLSLVIATLCFAFQIYCDFAGYSDIAIGAAQVMGFRLMQNFNRPYFATSISEFWRRWHISLSTWFRDYVYIPLGGNHASTPRWCFNIFITFLLSGLWHGANMTFVVWGGLHGIYYLLSSGMRKGQARLTALSAAASSASFFKFAQGVVTFALVCFAWIFFRANNLSDAMYVVTNLGTGWERSLVWGAADPGSIGLSQWEFILAVASVAFLLLVHGMQERFSLNNPGQSTGHVRAIIARQPAWVRWGAYAVMTLVIMNLGTAANIPFIYFQF